MLRRQIILADSHILFLVVAFVGMMLLWSDAAIDGRGEVTIYFNLFLSVLLYTISMAATDFVPSRYTSGLRMAALFLLFIFAESATCRIDYYLHLDGGVDSDETHRNTVRVGSIMVVAAALATFVCNHVIPHNTPAIPAGFVTVRHIAAMVAGITALAAQIIIYVIDDMCYVAIPHKFTVILTPAIFAIVTLTSHIYSDFAMQDFSFVIAVYWLVAAAPIFADYEHPTQSIYPELWRASVGLLFGAAILYVVATLVHGVMFRKQADTHEEKVKSFRMLGLGVQIALFLVAVGGAVTVYIRVAQDVPDGWDRSMFLYLVSALLLCPLGNILREATGAEAFHIVSFVLSFHVLGALFDFLHAAPYLQLGYVRGGVVFEVCAVIASMLWVPFVRAKEHPIWRLYERVPVWGAAVFLAWGVATAYTWGAVTVVPLGAQVFYRVWPMVLLIWLMSALARHRVDEERVMFFIALHIGLSGYVWLITEVQRQTFDYFTLFIACMILVVKYLIVGPGTEPFPFIHHLHAVKPVTPAGRHEAPGAAVPAPPARPPAEREPFHPDAEPHRVPITTAAADERRA